jgi:hypothetical protein
MTNAIRSLNLLELNAVAGGNDNCGDAPAWNFDPFAINDPVFNFPAPPPDNTAWGVPTPEPVMPKIIPKG